MFILTISSLNINLVFRNQILKLIVHIFVTCHLFYDVLVQIVVNYYKVVFNFQNIV